MACKENPDNSDKIEFLYKFMKGECPKSYGMNVALMSGMPIDIVERAKTKSDIFDHKMNEISKRCK